MFSNPRNAPLVPDALAGRNSQGQPVRWQVSGTGLDDLTLQPSILVGTPGKDECWHGFITNGEVK